MSSRTTINSIKSGDIEGILHLAGRVLACDRDRDRDHDRGSARIVLADGTGSLEIESDAASIGRIHAGDWIRARGTVEEARFRASSLEVLTPFRGQDPFPSPGGEYYRLHDEHQRAKFLRRRARCLAAIRAFFDQQGFVEVQTPHRVICPGLEPHLRAEPAGPGRFLITSPEYQMKRLLAGGLERIYFLGPCWRGDETGPQHLDEFCMLEWYQAFSTIEQLMEQTEALLQHLAREVTGGTTISYQGEEVRLELPFTRITVAEAFSRYAGVDTRGVTATAQLRALAQGAGIGPFTEDAPFEEVASRILVERVEPALGARPTFLHDFPAPLAALSRLKPDDPTVAERFELYAGGLELANAFGELTDPDEQLARLREDQRVRRDAGAPVHPVDWRFIEALREGIPPATGIALGVDRLVMLLCDAAHIGQVVAFAPHEI